MKITPIPLLQDNYAWILAAGDKACIVDPSEAGPVLALLEEKGLTLRLILNTHHHGDHTGGNAELKRRTGCRIIGPAVDAHRIPGMDEGVKEGDAVSFGGETVTVIETPGHTSGHICFYLPETKALFCGDTLFSLGCGRLFEGTATQMWSSLQKIMAMPDETLIYCGHEYTEANGCFCLSVEPQNEDIQAWMEDVRRLRAKNLPTLPVSLEAEKKTNVFLRAGNEDNFARLRAMKDSFKS